MAYPTLEQYNEALQHPKTALNDPILRQGTIRKTGLGLPLALCGGFALTYDITSGGRRYAVRCFHKEARGLAKRYEEITKALRTANSPYFVDFEFQPEGVNVGGSRYPIVRMEWGRGDTLGEFVESAVRNGKSLEPLRRALNTLARHLEDKGIAHGDVQPENVLVTGDGARLQLIDYDGMYVPAIQGMGASELGHRNFQHPGRDASLWDPTLDRFSFITLDVSLRLLESAPGLWRSTNSDPQAFIFRRDDFSNPESSLAFNDAYAQGQLQAPIEGLAKISKASVSMIPRLSAFARGEGIPAISIVFGPGTRASYSSQYPVIDAADYDSCLSYVGNTVVLVGRVLEVKDAMTKYGKPYIFLNFGHWEGKISKVSIWSDGLKALTSRPDPSWKGKWIAVTGLLEPPYQNPKFNYSHIAITVTKPSQIQRIDKSEAQYRLKSGSGSRGAGEGGVNRAVVQGMRNGTSDPGRQAISYPSPKGPSRNLQIVSGMKPAVHRAPKKPAQSSARRPTAGRSATPVTGSTSTSSRSGCATALIIIAVLCSLLMLFTR